MAASSDLILAFARAADRVDQPDDLPATLQAIVNVARDSMSGIDHVGISLAHRDGRLETAAATDDLVLRLDALQYDVREGPCVTALESSEPDDQLIVVEHAAEEGRWSRFLPDAVVLGLRAQLAARLFVGTETVGVLNLYSVTSATISEETRQFAELFATHAAVAYGHVRVRTNLHAALRSQEVIGQGVGIAMERFGLDEDQAFAYLVRVSSQSETKIRVVAEQLVVATDTAHRSEQPPALTAD